MKKILKNKHIQTILGSFRPKAKTIAYRWVSIDLPDGDFIEIARTDFRSPQQVLILLGLTGTIDAHYCQHLLSILVKAGFEVSILHYRGMGSQMNRKAQCVHSAETNDLRAVVEYIWQQHHPERLYGIGISMGGNILLHYLGKYSDKKINKAVAIAVPFELNACATVMPIFYQRFLLRAMRKYYEQKIALGMDLPFSTAELKKIKTIRDFDDCVTAKLFHFRSAEAYYAYASIRSKLLEINTPLLLIHADDDPFVPLDTVPHLSELNKNTTLLRFEKGGHAGFHASYFKRKYTYTKKLLNFLSME